MNLRSCASDAFIVAATFAGLMFTCPASATQFFAMKGQVQLQRVQTVSTAVVGMQLEEADTIVVAPDAEALVHFDDGAQMVVRGDSQVSFTRLFVAARRLDGASPNVFKSGALDGLLR